MKDCNKIPDVVYLSEEPRVPMLNPKHGIYEPPVAFVPAREDFIYCDPSGGKKVECNKLFGDLKHETGTEKRAA
ncbi:MAG: hypothetical protein HY514_02405 [Candidatus Aenigmarchaeota archaeon]|nr:hypothetical protein [Candidatus Aenigmarchaeota archaeon]